MRFLDDIVWMKSEYSVKNRIGGFQQYRNPLSYKPNAITEYLLVYRKHTDKLLDWNIKQYDATTIKMSKVEGGTVGRVARMLGRNFFLTEKEQKYFDYMKTLFAPDLLLRRH